MITLQGHLERITYYNEENHYTVARLKTDKDQTSVTVTGFMPAVSPGETLKIKGRWETHPKYGRQLKVESFEVVLPVSVDGIKKYLESGFIKGIGPKIVDALISRYKDRTLEIIEKNPEKLADVKGIGKVKAAQISNSWREHHALRDIMRFLQENKITTSYSAKIFKEYGNDAVNIIRNDPYSIAGDISGIGFYVADRIAQNLGVPKDKPERIKACVIHIIEQFVAQGHVFVYEKQIFKRCENLFQIERSKTKDAMLALADAGELVIEKIAGAETGAVYLKSLHEAETGIADRIKAVLSVPVSPLPINSEQITQEVLRKLAVKLSCEQLNVLQECLSHRVIVITGGPGTGKTTLIKSINAVFELLGKRIILAAPTGRAARRLSEVTRREAHTIHKVLGYNFKDGFFDKNQDNPLDADAIIVDEASMVDVYLMFYLLKAISMHCVLILVGDVFQLPSVGPGNVLADIINSKRIKTFELKKIFRQAQESPIVMNAHRVRAGEMPDLKKEYMPEKLSEFYFIEQNNPDRAVETIIELCSERIPKVFGFDCVNDIQVLTPMHKGVVGTANLNQALQKALNPDSAGSARKGGRFKIEDKVMHLKNNYQKEVFNGDIGTITSIDTENSRLSVNYYGRIVAYDFAETDELSLAYAITVHKSQGSEYPAVVVPIMTQHFALLQRNLLYTAITRGKKLVILVGSKKSINIALKNDRSGNRLSGLSNRLMKGSGISWRKCMGIEPTRDG
ncbi:MAG: ATP-dependent RecD-like DNA helicase, partial [Desulfobacteraceae bacterium]|nr:ATP-dependent RecD-like DNA helicase [Desulfobacteraceae bacterium]